MSNGQLTDAVFRIDNDIRRAGSLIECGAVASLSGTAITLLGTAISKNNYTGRLDGVVIATTVIGGLAGIAGIAITIAGAVKMRNVRITQKGLSITF